MHDVSSERIRAVNRALLLYLFFALLALTSLLLVAVAGVIAEAIAETQPVTCEDTSRVSSRNAPGAKRGVDGIFGAVLAALPQAGDGITYASEPRRHPVMRGGWSQDRLVLVVNYEPDNAVACERHVFVSTGTERDGELPGEWVTGQAGDKVLLSSLREAGHLSRSFGTELGACGDLIIYGLSLDPASHGPETEGGPTLLALADLLRGDAGLRVRIVGHRAASGDPGRDQALSVNDAATVKELLVERYGAESKRIVVEGAGSEEPMADNATVTGRAANSRIEVVAERSCQRSRDLAIATHRER